MELLDLLKDNKGTVSSKLGKDLAVRVLKGDTAIFQQAVDYACYELDKPEAKSIRAGAAKIIEKTAEKKPSLLAPELERLKPALSVPEPQTRWMLIQVFGYCAKLNPEAAISVMDIAKSYLTENAGVCLTGAAYRYFGYVGATSETAAQDCMQVLDQAILSASLNEIDWILEGFMLFCHLLPSEDKKVIEKHTENQLDSTKKSTQKRAVKLMKKLSL